MEGSPNINSLPDIETLLEEGNTNHDDDRRERNINDLIDTVYPEVGDDNLQDDHLASTNASVRRMNEMVAERPTGETKEYLASKGLPAQTRRVLERSELLRYSASPDCFEGSNSNHHDSQFEQRRRAEQWNTALSRFTTRAKY
ncbi:Helitron helicase [Phytophthora megakarya]|uniref:Helitron helicase n=1 Tax=Phytophthora megakarya TaxID=4795 RepID=A0A225WG57_9STRA|nr:Helitron helicase [Phytophthora megakarya]